MRSSYRGFYLNVEQRRRVVPTIIRKVDDFVDRINEAETRVAEIRDFPANENRQIFMIKITYNKKLEIRKY